METITDKKFWEECVKCEEVLSATSRYIGKLESNDCNLSDIYKVFLEMQHYYQNNPAVINLVNQRWEFIHTPSMGFAYYLDPRTGGGKGMVGDDIASTDEQLRNFIRLEKKLCLDANAINDEIWKFNHAMLHISQKSLDLIERNGSLQYWHKIGSDLFPILYKVVNFI